MAFTGTMGAAAAMTPIGVLSAPGGALAYAADAIRLTKTPLNSVTPILQPRLANLRFTMAAGQNQVLQALAVGVADPANGDTGSLVTAAPGVNQHGIPANFGPGRGNWTQNDLERLRVHIQAGFYSTAAITNVGGPLVASRVLAAGDITILVRNMSQIVLVGLVIDLEWRHSVVVA